MNKKILVVAATAALAVVPTTNALASSFMDKYDAADEVSRVADRRYNIDPLVTCRQIGSKVFTCDVLDFANDCSYNGRATVKKMNRYTFRVTYLRVRKSCF